MWSPTTPVSGGRAVFPTSGAPDSCEMVLARGLGTHGRRVRSRAHCSRLELSLHTVILTLKSQKGLAAQGSGVQPSSDVRAETSMMLWRAPLCPWGRGSSSWCGLRGVRLQGKSSGARPPASRFGKQRSLQPAAWTLETLISANLLRVSWFLPQKTRHDAAGPRIEMAARAGVNVFPVQKRS